MRLIPVVLASSAVLALASCATKEQERKPVPPPSSASQIPWNQPLPGQGGGAFGALPQQPRR